MFPVLLFVLLTFLLLAFHLLFLPPLLFIGWGAGPARFLFLLRGPLVTRWWSRSLSWLSVSTLFPFVSLFSVIVVIIITGTSAMLATSHLLYFALRCRFVLFTLLSAGAAYIQNNVFLGVDSDKISALKCQVARWEKGWRIEIIVLFYILES